MKTKIIALLCWLPLGSAFAQSATTLIPDTLVNERFENDPTPFMLPVPSGDDTDWVNYDVDGDVPLCVENGPTPQGWYWEGDLSYANPGATDNNAFTSCSFLDLSPGESHNRNWLILKPVLIPDSTYWLCWRSLAFQGPMFVDGYKVLVSGGSNIPSTGSFQDTLFVAAQMLSPIDLGSLNVNDYIYSPGYIQANAYTDTNYYFTGFTPNGLPFYRGKLEPHVASLAQFAGQTIYIAFLHDSDDDNLIQIDDIIVSNVHTTSTQAQVLPDHVLYFEAMPNPVRSATYLSWKIKTAREGRILITAQTGQLMMQQTFSSRQEGQMFVQMQDWAPGVYYCILETSEGRATTKLLKL